MGGALQQGLNMMEQAAPSKSIPRLFVVGIAAALLVCIALAIVFSDSTISTVLPAHTDPAISTDLSAQAPTEELFNVPTSVPWSKSGGYTVGSGFNSLTGKALSQQCLSDFQTTTTQTNSAADGADITYTFREITSQKDMSDALDASMSGSYSGFGVSVTGSAKFSNSHTYSSFKATYVLKITVSLTNVQVDASNGHTTWNSKLNTLSSTQLSSLCGDSFIFGATRGGVFYAVMTMDKSDSSSSQDIGANLSFDGWGGKLEAEMNSKTSSGQKSGSLNIAVHQIGGKASSFTELGRDLDSLFTMAKSFPGECKAAPVPFRALLKPWTMFYSYVTGVKNQPKPTPTSQAVIGQMNAQYQGLNRYYGEIDEVTHAINAQPSWAKNAGASISEQPYLSSLCADVGCSGFVRYKLDQAKYQLQSLFEKVQTGTSVSLSSLPNLDEDGCFNAFAGTFGLDRLMTCARYNTNSKSCSGNCAIQLKQVAYGTLKTHAINANAFGHNTFFGACVFPRDKWATANKC